MKKNPMIWAAMFAFASLSVGCGGPNQYSRYDSPPPSQYRNYQVGVVDRIEIIKKGGDSNVAGTVIGGIIGGLIGHQFGRGSGQTAATIAGAAGGAVAGNAISNRSRGADETFRVVVRMEGGGHQTIIQDDITDLRTGDRVRVEAGRVYPY